MPQNNHQHSNTPIGNCTRQHNHQQQHHDSSDCGSSSGLGGMGTPVKGVNLILLNLKIEFEKIKKYI